MKKLVVVFALLILGSAPAYADHEYDYGHRDDYGDCRSGGCGNEREEDYENTGCKYFCPSFEDSPVQDAFNPTICVMPGSCTDRGQEEQPAPAR